MDIRIGISTTSMGHGHILKAIPIKRALDEIGSFLRKRGINIYSKILNEKNMLSPAAISVRDFIEMAYNAISTVPRLRIWLDKVTKSMDDRTIFIIERIVARANRAAGGNTVRFDEFYPIDAMISTHPSDRAVMLPKNTLIVRLDPDIFAHSFHFIPTKWMDEWYAVMDGRLRLSIVQGHERALNPKYLPKNTDRIVSVGAMVHPANLRNLRKAMKLLKNKKMPVMFQIGGAGAQQDIYLEIMKHLDYNSIEPTFVASTHEEFFDKLLDQALALSLITGKEHYLAKNRFMQELDYKGGIIRFSSGLKIQYCPKRYKSVEIIDTIKTDNVLNVAKPGDVTNASIPYLLLYHIGTQEIANGNWATIKGFAEWLIPVDKYERMRKEMLPNALDIIYGRKAARRVNEIANDRRFLEEKYAALIKLDSKGAYNTAVLAILLALKRRGENIEKVYNILRKKRLTTLDKSICDKINKNYD